MDTTSSTAQALGQLAHGLALISAATTAISASAPAAGHAAYFAWLTEQASAAVAHAQIHATDALLRSGAHLLEVDSFAAIVQAGVSPSAAQLQGLGGELCPGRASYSNTGQLLTEWLNIPVAVAKQRQSAAQMLIARVDDAGQRQAPVFEQLAQQFANPANDPRLVGEAARKMAKVCQELPEAQHAARREELEARSVQIVREQPQSARKLLGQLASAEIAEQRPPAALLAQAGVYKRGMRQGLMEYHFKLLPQDAELFESVWDLADNPNTQLGDREDLALAVHASLSGQPAAARWDDPCTMPSWARDPETAQTPPEPATPTEIAAPLEPANQSAHTSNLEPPTELSPALRRLTALLQVLRSAQSRGSAPGVAPGLIAPKVMIHLDYEKMLAKVPGAVSTEHGLPLTATEARTLLCEANIYPVTFGGQGQVLDVGRSRRLFPAPLRRALAARDRGCLFPGCSVPAGRCEAHHCQWWELGGPTSLDNGALLCVGHHHAVHAGIFTILTAKNSPPQILMPEYLDSSQTPQRNNFWAGSST